MKKILMVLVVLGLLVFGVNCQKKTKEAKVETKVEEQIPAEKLETQEAAPAETTAVKETDPAVTVPAPQ
ncbi:hypothetical protein KJ762_01535 [bacterium]|nr:hypothetical protein [bacterium]MBU1063896.1 hypothetical protein [bacterium]MBU1633171.1 hypothetical protein [bacterium]MBU1874839.1 hypothetical protein [bacterium]